MYPLLVFVTSVFTFLALSRIYRSARPQNNEPPMLPYWIPWLGHAISYFRDSEALLDHARSYFGSSRPFALKIAGKLLYIISDPKDTAAVFRNTKTLDFDHFVADLLREMGMSEDGVTAMYTPHDPGPERYYDDTVLMSNSHDFYRDHLAPGPSLDSLMANFLGELDRHLDDSILGTNRSWRDDHTAEIPLYPWTLTLLSTVVSNVFFGPSLIEQTPDFIPTWLKFESQAWKLFYQYPRFLARDVHECKDHLINAYEKYYRSWAEIKHRVSNVMAKRKRMLEAGGLNYRDMAVMTFSTLLGIHSNAPKALFWTLSFILSTPGLAVRLRDEISKGFEGDKRTPRIPSTEHLMSSCPLLLACINESLRINSQTASTRIVEEDTLINGCLLRKGGILLAPSYHLHRNPTWGSDPLLFNPERFLSDPSLDKTANSNFRPFGGGKTYCPGRFLAKQEIAGFIAMVLDRYDIEIIGGKAVVPKMNRTIPSVGTAAPLDGDKMFVKIRRRTGLTH